MGRRKVEKLQKDCQICKKSAVGFHYGAYVCEACKKFFVRHSSGVCRSYGSCQESGQCNLNFEGRGKCQFCRYKRCVDVGMSINYKSSDYNLTTIPCQVCGSKSSGLHFGCITCEGCKGFFRRMIKFKGLLVCFNSNKCSLDFVSRNMCKSCRLDRCLKIGMSRKGIRIGRHPNFLKHRCLQQVEEQLNRINEEPVTLTEESVVNSKDVKDIIMNFDESEVDNDVDKDEDMKENVVDSNLIVTETLKNVNEIIPPKSMMMKSELVDFHTPVLSAGIVQLNESQMASNDDDGNESGQSIYVVNSHFDDFVEKFENLSVPFKIDDFETIFSTTCAFLTPKYQNIREMQNVLPKDNPPKQSIWSMMMDHFVYHSQFIVKFAKQIPGFSKLSLSDKKIIIKYSLYPMILIELGQDYMEFGIEIYYNYFDFSVSDRQSILEKFPEFVDFNFHIRDSGSFIYKLGLDSIGLILFCGLMMFFSYEKLENWYYGKAMKTIYQNRLASYLELGLHLSPKECKVKLEKCMQLMTILNHMNEQHHKTIFDFCVTHVELEYPDLYMEVFNK